MRILKILDVPIDVPGGISNFAFSTGDALGRAGDEVAYMTRSSLLPWLPTAAARRTVAPWVALLRIWLRHRRRPVDIVELDEEIAYAYCIAWRRLRLPPAVVMVHGLAPLFWQAEVERLAKTGRRPRRRTRITIPLTFLWPSRVSVRHAAHVLVTSEEDRRYLRTAVGLPQNRVSKINTGVDPTFLSTPRTLPPNRPPRVAFVGNWIDRKGVSELVTAWTALSARFPDAHLSVLCAVVPAPQVQRSFPEGVPVEVTSTMSPAELAAALEEHDIFVLPSWFEGGPSLASLQAAAAGLACVVTDIGGSREVFRPSAPERDGAVMVPPHDPAALEVAIAAVLGDEGLRASLARAAHARAASLTWDAAAQGARSAYEAALREVDA